MDSPSGLFWDFGSLYRRRCGVVSDVLSRQPSFSSTSLRRLWLGVAAQACGTSLSDISAFPDVAASRITRRRATATRFLHAGVRLRNQRFPHAGERLQRCVGIVSPLEWEVTQAHSSRGLVSRLTSCTAWHTQSGLVE